MPTDILLDPLRQAALRAGAVVMSVYSSDFGVYRKDDDSPVTQADEQAEALIVAALQALEPDTPIVAEEAVAAGRTPAIADRFWLVDPLDGTREFIQRNGEFTVNIALIEGREPVLGVVLAPARGQAWWGARGKGATARDADGRAHAIAVRKPPPDGVVHAPALGQLFAGVVGGAAYIEDTAGRRAIRCRRVPDAGVTVLASRSHGDEAALAEFLRGQRVADVRRSGSSLKLCLLAAGEADLYPRLGRTMEWDTAAGHAVLAAAGGRITDLSGMPLRYGKPGFENPHFVAHGL
jgi:3'(2'), 5'-bisphosphate nucleotidase